MTEPKWELTLSVTDRNNIGLIQPRKNNTNSELMRVHVTNKNGEPYDLTAIKVFFVTHFTGKDNLKVPVQKEATIINAKEGIFEFTLDEECMQKVGRQQAYFEIYDYDKFLDTTQNFTYEIISSSRNMKVDFTPWIGTWAAAEEMLDEGTAKVLNDKIENISTKKAEIVDVDNKLQKKTDNETFVAITADMQRQIKNTQSGMVGEYNSESELRAAYPNGVKGYAVVWHTESDAKIGYSYTYKNGSWVKGQVWNGMGIPDKSISEIKLDFPAISGEMINLVDKDKIRKGLYVDYRNGEIIKNEWFSVTDRIYLIPGTKLYFSHGDDQQCAFYDAADNYISGKVKYSDGDIVPPETSFGIFTLKNSITDIFMINVNKKYDKYVPFGNFLHSYQIIDLNSHILSVIKNKKQVSVKIDGTGDFTSFVKSLESIKDASEENRYVVMLHEGTHNIWINYSIEQINSTSFRGPFVPDYVDVVGIGDNRKIILDGRLNDSFSWQTQERVSPLHINSFNELHNFTILGKNTRYCLHQDFNIKGRFAVNILKMMRLIKFAGGGLRPALGAGCLDGATYIYEDCYFESEMGTPFSLHNNRNFKTASVWNLTNCVFRNKSNQTGRFGHSLELLSEGSGTNDIVNIIGCDMPDGIFNASHTADIHGLNTEGSIDLCITGYGNTIAPNVIKNTDGKDNVIEFNEEIIIYKTDDVLKRGDAVKVSKKGYVSKMTTDDPYFLFKGIVLKFENGLVYVKVAGYIESSRINLASSQGDRIGIVNGNLSKIETNDFVAVSETNDFVLLK